MTELAAGSAPGTKKGYPFVYTGDSYRLAVEEVCFRLCCTNWITADVQLRSCALERHLFLLMQHKDHGSTEIGGYYVGGVREGSVEITTFPDILSSSYVREVASYTGITEEAKASVSAWQQRIQILLPHNKYKYLSQMSQPSRPPPECEVAPPNLGFFPSRRYGASLPSV